MKKQTKKQTYSKVDNRKEWKDEIENEIDTLQNDIDNLELPESTVLEIEKLINKFKERALDCVNLFDVTTFIAFDQKDLFSDMLDDIYYERAIVGESETERMMDILSESKKGVFIKCESLAEQYKVEEFYSQLVENPYQLKLIA